MLTRSLKTGTIGTEAHQIVLPSQVVHAARVAMSLGQRLHLLRSTYLYGVSSRSASGHRGGKDEQFVVRRLAGHGVAFAVVDHHQSRVWQIEPLGHRAHRYFYHLARAVYGQGVFHRYGKGLLLAASPQQRGCRRKHK